MGAAQHDGVDLAARVGLQKGLQLRARLRGSGSPGFHQLHQSMADYGDHVVAVARHQPLEFLQTQRRVGGQHDHLAAVAGVVGGL